MTNRRTIYAVTEGEYSDYSILCAYENEKDAKAAVAAGVGDDFRELPLLPAGDIPRKVLVHRVSVILNTKTREVEEPYWTDEEWDFYPTEGFVSDPINLAGDRRRGAHFRGTDKERVLKAARDKAAKLRAEQEGL